jgi:membrane protein implicated in regulation of membrane protease activity
MTWTNVYFVCFLLGFSLSAVSWLMTATGFHLPHLPHGGHATHGAGASGHAGIRGHVHADTRAHGLSAHTVGGPPVLNFSTITAFLAWFGGAGFLLTSYGALWPLAAFAVALAVGGVGASIVFWFMAKVLWSPRENLDPDDYDLVGLLGAVSQPIREGGTGEILFTQAGGRRAVGARSEDGGPIGKGIEVVITRYENGLAYVRTWAELSADR